MDKSAFCYLRVDISDRLFSFHSTWKDGTFSPFLQALKNSKNFPEESIIIKNITNLIESNWNSQTKVSQF